MNPSQIAAAVNRCTHRVVFSRRQQCWTLERFHPSTGSWLPGVVLEADDALEAVSTLSPLESPDSIYFYPSISTAVTWVRVHRHSNQAMLSEMTAPLRYAADLAVRAGVLQATGGGVLSVSESAEV